jgi:TPR repeat protein
MTKKWFVITACAYNSLIHKISLKLLAMEWFRLAAQQGHPRSSYNLAIGHLSGLKTNLEVGDAHELIKHASDHGVVEAIDVYDNVCKHGRCD